MKITIHRGQNQIGGCITEIESGSGTRILIDLGHNLPEGDTPSEDKYDIPENMDELLKGCSAVLYTHYHGDHLGFAAEGTYRTVCDDNDFIRYVQNPLLMGDDNQ